MDPLIQDIDLPKQPTMTYRETAGILYGHPCHVHVDHGSEGHRTKLKCDGSATMRFSVALTAAAEGQHLHACGFCVGLELPKHGLPQQSLRGLFQSALLPTTPYS